MLNALFLTTALCTLNLTPQHTHAQALLDTGRTSFGTRAVHTIAPGASDTWEMNRTRNAEVDRLGQIWELEDTDMKIRVFSADDHLLHTPGGVGSGPGEFRRFRFIQALADTTWVYDPTGARLTAFSITNGKMLKSSQPGAANTSMFALSPREARCSDRSVT